MQLITYADSLGGNLQKLKKVLTTDLKELFDGVHILPPFPSSGDRGFAPIDYKRIEPLFGDWDDIAALGKSHEVVLDLMVNHVSSRSPMFQDFLRKGNESAYADYFLTPEKIWGTSSPDKVDMDKIVLRRAQPWSDYEMASGKKVRVWTTFGATDPSEQVDLDVQSSAVREYLQDLFVYFAANGVKMIRLDAVGYVIKKPGTSCFFVEPEIYDFLKWTSDTAEKAGLKVLSEIHAECTVQNSLAAKGYTVYDFLLPYTVLHTLLLRDSKLLYRVLDGRPHNQVTMLDCHDGVPVQPDMDGWLTADELWKVVNICERRGARFTKMRSAEKRNPNAPDVHQICGTYFSLLGEDEDALVAARAIQLFVPGIPQVYYVGLLAGVNDYARADVEQDNRELNRHNYTEKEIYDAIQKPVVQRLMNLLVLRNTHPAFDGDFTAIQTNDKTICLCWAKEDVLCELTVDLHTTKSTVKTENADGVKEIQL